MNAATTVEYVRREGNYGWLYLDFKINGSPFGSFGPYFSEAARLRSLNETLNALRINGAKDVSPAAALIH